MHWRHVDLLEAERALAHQEFVLGPARKLLPVLVVVEKHEIRQPRVERLEDDMVLQPVELRLQPFAIGELVHA